MLNAELHVISGKQTGNVISLPEGRFLIGREEDCHLRPNSDLVSRHHCVFHTDDYTVRLRDLGSTNGTLVNGERLQGEVVLKSGDHVKVGQLEFEVQIGEGAAVAAAAPETGAVIDAGDSPADAASETVVAPLPSAESAPDPAQEFSPQPADPAPHDPALQETTAIHSQGDTVMQPGAVPGYGQPVGYPMPYPQYPYGQMYGMPMIGYPHQAPMPYMPPGGYPQQQMPMQPPQQEASASSAPDVRLPDPSTTGAKAEAAAAPSGEGQAKPSEEAATRQSATDIINQYLHRRPK